LIFEIMKNGAEDNKQKINKLKKQKQIKTFVFIR